MKNSLIDSTSLQDLVATDMDRREFLVYLGAVILVVTGLASLAKTVVPTAPAISKRGAEPVGYGGRPYGR